MTYHPNAITAKGVVWLVASQGPLPLMLCQAIWHMSVVRILPLHQTRCTFRGVSNMDRRVPVGHLVPLHQTRCETRGVPTMTVSATVGHLKPSPVCSCNAWRWPIGKCVGECYVQVCLFLQPPNGACSTNAPQTTCIRLRLQPNK